MVIDKSQIKPANTWRLERAKQRILQQQQMQSEKFNSEKPADDSNTIDPLYSQAISNAQNDNPHSLDINTNSGKPQWRPQYQDPNSETASDVSSTNDRRTSAHSFTKILPNSITSTSSLSSVMDDVKAHSNALRQDSTYTVYSDASDRFSFDTATTATPPQGAVKPSHHGYHHHSPASSTSSNHLKTTELRMEPLLPRSSPTASHFPIK